MPPTQRHTSSRRDRRRGQLKLTAPIMSVCGKCKAPALPHRMCENCGTYRGRVVVDVLARLTKKERKLKERELAMQEAATKSQDFGARTRSESEGVSEKQPQGMGAPLSVEELSKR